MNVLSLHIEPSAAEPIYRQIVSQITRLVAAGHLAAGERVPSVRDVAMAHAINPMTVSKAYAQLEAAGVLARLRGRGMVVAAHGQPPASEAERVQALAPALQALARQAQQLSLSPDCLVQALRQAMDDAHAHNKE